MSNEQLTFTTIGGEPVSIKLRGKHYIEPRGYFYHPGTGPDGETCGSCAHIVSGRRWKKCGLSHSIWNHSRGTDILSKAAACKYWEPSQKP